MILLLFLQFYAAQASHEMQICMKIRILIVSLNPKFVLGDCVLELFYFYYLNYFLPS